MFYSNRIQININSKSEICDEVKFHLKSHESRKMLILFGEYISRMFNALYINWWLCEGVLFLSKKRDANLTDRRQTVPVSPTAQNAFDFPHMNHIIEVYAFKFNLQFHSRSKTDDTLNTQPSHHDPYVKFLKTLSAFILKFVIKYFEIPYSLSNFLRYNKVLNRVTLSV